MWSKKQIWAYIEMAGRAETIATLFKVYVLPSVLPVLVIALGYIESQSWMWIIMASALTFGGVSLGILAFSEYRERKNPAHKLNYLATQFACGLVPAPMPIGGNREQRRTQLKAKQEPQMLGPQQISLAVERKLNSGQIGVQVKNNASFPISCLLFKAVTKLEDLTPPRTEFPKKPKLLGPGETVLISDEAIDLDELPCGTISGEMDFRIRYGSPGNEKHELHLHANLQIEIQKFGFVSGIHTHWIS